MKKKIALYSVTLILLSIFAQITIADNKPQLNDLLKKIDNYYKINDKLQGDFVLINNKTTYKGHFLFMNPDKFKIIFGKKETINTKKIICTGKRLWLYLPNRKLVIEQDLEVDAKSKQHIPASITGIKPIIYNYNCSFVDKNPNLINIKDIEEKVYLIKCEPKKDNREFKEIILYVNKDGFIVKNESIKKNGSKIVFIRTNIKKNTEITNDDFITEAPEDTEIIKNPFLSVKKNH